MTTEAPLAYALAYAKRGWPAFPLHTPIGDACSCGHVCDRIGKHPRTARGLLDATTDQAMIYKWWRDWPAANIGIACGPAGLAVVDIDPRHGGDQSLADLIEKHGPLPETVETITGGGGRHILFKNPNGLVVKSKTIAAGLDMKAGGGYICAPPSLHASGRLYQFEFSRHPKGTALAPLPAWLAVMAGDAMRNERAEAANPDGWVAMMLSRGADEGERNNTAAKLAGYFHRHRLDSNVTLVILAGWNQLNRPPLAQVELERVVENIDRYPVAPATPKRGELSEGITI